MKQLKWTVHILNDNMNDNISSIQVYRGSDLYCIHMKLFYLHLQHFVLYFLDVRRKCSWSAIVRFCHQKLFSLGLPDKWKNSLDPALNICCGKMRSYCRQKLRYFWSKLNLAIFENKICSSLYKSKVQQVVISKKYRTDFPF